METPRVMNASFILAAAILCLLVYDHAAIASPHKTTNFTLTSFVPLEVTILPSLSYRVVPSVVTILPLGKQTINFTVTSLLDDVDLNMIVVDMSILVPVVTFLGFPTSGPATKTIQARPGEKIFASGVGQSITRLFYGASWQTFPQLSGVTLSDQTIIHPTPNTTKFNYTRFGFIPVPTLM